MLNVVCHRYNQLLAAVSSSLQELGAAMSGLVAMSADLELVAAALRDGRVSGPCLLASCSLPSPAIACAHGTAAGLVCVFQRLGQSLHTLDGAGQYINYLLVPCRCLLPGSSAHTLHSSRWRLG